MVFQQPLTALKISFPALVRNVRITDSDTSVIVSWEKINVTGYIVYYRPVSGRNGQDEMSVAVPGTESSVAIPACVLMSGVEYQFQVAATAEFRGQKFVGDRNTRIIASLTLSHGGIMLNIAT